MKTERYIWIGAIILALFIAQSQSQEKDSLEFLIKTYDAETQIQTSQILDLTNQMAIARDTSYSKGFEDGRTQAGIALAKGGSLYDYKEGYHAALTQKIEDSDVLEVSEGLFNELNSLRKMVPRLLNQNADLSARLEAASGAEYALEVLLEDIDASAETDAVYLEIIDLLLDGSSFDHFVPLPRLHNKALVKEDK